MARSIWQQDKACAWPASSINPQDPGSPFQPGHSVHKCPSLHHYFWKALDIWWKIHIFNGHTGTCTCLSYYHYHTITFIVSCTRWRKLWTRGLLFYAEKLYISVLRILLLNNVHKTGMLPNVAESGMIMAWNPCITSSSTAEVMSVGSLLAA